MGVAKTAITISVTLLVASLSLSHNGDIFNKELLVYLSSVMLIVSAVFTGFLIYYRIRVVRPYKKLINWAHDKMAHVLDISSGMGLTAKLAQEVKELQAELESIERDIKKATKK